mmetsp:Transcript_77320/g.121784  ORF Transcript_77320/g.121784 Transcript_77320/m.121784 type:complete len:207 (+) Transcript_77320:586-1206(+)
MEEWWSLPLRTVLQWKRLPRHSLRSVHSPPDLASPICLGRNAAAVCQRQETGCVAPSRVAAHPSRSIPDPALDYLEAAPGLLKCYQKAPGAPGAHVAHGAASAVPRVPRSPRVHSWQVLDLLAQPHFALRCLMQMQSWAETLYPASCASSLALVWSQFRSICTPVLAKAKESIPPVSTKGSSWLDGTQCVAPFLAPYTATFAQGPW